MKLKFVGFLNVFMFAILLCYLLFPYFAQLINPRYITWESPIGQSEALLFSCFILGGYFAFSALDFNLKREQMMHYFISISAFTASMLLNLLLVSAIAVFTFNIPLEQLLLFSIEMQLCFCITLFMTILIFYYTSRSR